MISIGKRRSDERKLDDLMIQPHTLRIRVNLMDLNHNHKKNLTPYFSEGQVTVDADADVTRELDLTLFDPAGKVRLEPDDPSETGIFIADMISVIYVVQDPKTDDWFEIPVFCGPVDSVERDDVEVSVKCVGKESLGLTNLWNARHFREGQEKTWVIKQILTDLMGETKLQIPNKAAKLPHDQKLSQDDMPWKVAKNIANSMNMQLFYDGRGVAVLRKKGGQPVLELNRAHLNAEPKPAYDLSATVNAVRVTGGKATPKAKHPVKARAIAQRSHPLSPWNLGRGGQPRFLWVSIQDDSLRTVKECKDLAQKVLRRGLLGGVTVTADGIPSPRLQELDIVRMRTDQVAITHPIRQFTIPLVAGEDASYGYKRKIRPRGGWKRIHRRRHHHHRDHPRRREVV
jgi:hypothetical protein